MLSFRAIIDRIKQNFLLKKFINSISESQIIKDLNDICTHMPSLFTSETEQINEKFDNISTYISKKSVINEITNILCRYYRWNKLDENMFIRIDARKLLSAWLIYYCPTIILGQIDSNEKKFIFVYSEKIINLLQKINNKEKIDMVQFNKIFLGYSNSFMLYLEKDKIDKINYYTAEWISLDKSYELINKSNKYTLEQKDIILKNINNDKKMIEEYINKIFKNFDYDRLKLIINLSNNISKKIINNYKNIIYDDINNNKFEISSKILDDIKKFILMFNRKEEEINRINDTIDGEYFIGLIKNNVLDIDDVKLFGDCIVKYVCAIGSVTCEIENLKKWNDLKNIYVSKSKQDLIKLIADILIFVLEIIDIIRNELLDYEFLLQHIYSK